QGGLFLPKPNSISEYYLFHESEEFFNYNSTNVYRPISLSYSIIDVALDSGKGGIENNFKNIHLIDDTLTHGKLSAVRHANGRDWWLIIHRFNSNLFYKFIITPYTILGPFTQNIGSFNPADVYFGQTKFSEDGNHYFIQLQNDSVDLFVLAIVGGAFSPSGRFLYLNNDRKIHQFDLWASNIQSSDSIVAVWDSTGTPSIFYESTLAPDGRIYLCTYVGTTILHYIEYPDSLGTACSIIQNSFVTPNPNTFCFPNYANYELGADIGSICDTLLYISLNEIQAAEKEKLNIFYHPAWQTAFINASGIQGKNYSLSIFDITGKQLFYEQGKISSQYFTKDLHCNFANGIYIVSFSTDREKLISRFIIQ
ncbi:MAG: T9SS type A sorting domain-containing protein, partial [Bacteroidetes bacterium]|nr:T9SS type A sorting domain-containing protein [Bacteroidota bacterium]